MSNLANFNLIAAIIGTHTILPHTANEASTGNPSARKKQDTKLAMDASNLSNILKLPNASEYSGKIMLMREFDPKGKGSEVPDPYFGGEDGFQEVFEILDRTMLNFIEHLGRTHPGINKD